jgi:drug/metabolite transporter (DMT)-like permease
MPADERVWTDHDHTNGTSKEHFAGTLIRQTRFCRSNLDGRRVMGSMALALVASLGWGLSEFLGGATARRLPLVVVLIGSQLVGTLGAIPVVALHAQPLPHDADLLLGVLAGVAGTIELSLVYAALRRGPAVVIAPIAAVGAAIPAAVGLLTGDALTVGIAAGMAAALAGSAVVAWTPPDDRGSRRDTVFAAATAAGAAIGTGTMFILFEPASAVDPYWAAAALRVGGFVSCVVLVAVLFTRRATTPGDPDPRAWTLTAPLLLTVVAIGAADLAADVAFAGALSSGSLSIVSVLASLYTVVTVALGVLVLRERPGRIGLAGAALASAGVAILAATG